MPVADRSTPAAAQIPRRRGAGRAWAALAALVLLSALIQTTAAMQKSFWEDEAYTAEIAARATGERDAAVSADVHPPLYLNLAAAWGRIFGYEEIGLRSLSILFAAVALVFTFLLARDLLGERAALFAAALLTLMPLWLMFAQQARYYSISAALAVLCAFSALRFARTGRAAWLAVFTAATVASLYLVYTAVIVAVLCNLWVLYFIFAAPISDAARRARRLGLWAAAQVVILAVYLPGAAGLLQLAGRYPQAAAIAGWPLELLKRLLYSGYVYALGETLSPLHPVAWVGAAAVFLLLISALRAHGRTPGFWFAATFAGGILAFNLALSLNAAVSATWQALPARNLSLLPFLAICLGGGAAALRPAFGAALVGALVVVYAFAGFNYITGRAHLRPIFATPWREVFSDIRAQSGPQAVVLCSRGDTACFYYQQRFGLPRNSAGDWPAARGGPEIWWIQVNLDRTASDPVDLETLAAMRASYRQSSVTRYAIQDKQIQALKQRWLGQEAASERLTVYRFTDPIEEHP